MAYEIPLLIIIMNICLFITANATPSMYSTGPRVFLTVSSLAGVNKDGTVFQRRLNLNWNNIADDESNKISLFTKNPLETPHSFQTALVTILPHNYPEGTFKSSVTFEHIELELNNTESECLGYYIALIHTNQLVTSSCLRSNPNWMYRNKDSLGKKKLSELMIPGTHNSGCYTSYNAKLDAALSVRYLYCQDESIKNQLMYGIRYLDIRPSYRVVTGSNETIWVAHGIWIAKVSLASVIAQVKAFMKATNEVVILDFHRFENGFDGRLLGPKRHKILMEMLINELEEYIIPLSFGYSKTLNELWDSGKRLLIGYASPLREESNLLFPEVRHVWGDTDTLNGLESYLNSVMCNFHFGPLWAAMAELTATAAGLLTDKYDGIRKMAEDVNLPVTNWFREKWWSCANTVATDYFLGNDLINVAIESNLKR